MAGYDDNLLAPGSVFGRYAIGRRLGQGGMGAVYEAVHLDLRKRVALKALLPEAVKDPIARARFLREGETAARLRHPNVVDVSDVGECQGVLFLVMEFLDGEDLADLLVREGALPLERLADLMLPVLDAVAAAHDAGIVHRDIKPENIFLARTRHDLVEPKLLDFGISKVADLGAGEGLTTNQTMVGTTLYMAPEQAQNSKDVDTRADQYSLGVILYECATGRHPFVNVARQDSLYALLDAVVKGSFPPPRKVRPGLPEGFERLVLRAMSGDRAQRFTSAHTMAGALLPFASPAVRLIWESRLGERAITAKTAQPAFWHPRPEDTLSPASRTVTTLVPVRAPKPKRLLPRVLGGVALTTLLAGGVALNALRGGPRPTHATTSADAAQPPRAPITVLRALPPPVPSLVVVPVAPVPAVQTVPASTPSPVQPVSAVAPSAATVGSATVSPRPRVDPRRPGHRAPHPAAPAEVHGPHYIY